MPLPPILNNLRLPVIASPMFIVSSPSLVIAQCKSGIVGSFPALNARPQSVLEDWLIEITTSLALEQSAYPNKKIAPFAVNQICHRSNDRLDADMDLCIKYKVPIIITSLRPPQDIVDKAHSYGGLVFHDVINQKHAHKAADRGVDGLILVSSGAGGHAGTLNPLAFVRETKAWFDGTILLSGAIGDGYSLAAAQAMGADLGYIGSRFIATQEANADIAYKKMLIDCSSEDIFYTPFFSGVYGNYLKPSILSHGYDINNLPDSEKTKMDFSHTGTITAKTWKDIWSCGQGIGTISTIDSVESVVASLESDYHSAISDLQEKYSSYI